jgi:O-antigen/teichoic acid export membrane protein
MKHPSAHPARDTLVGTLRVFLADMMILPTGLLTTAYLTRRLGPEGYGLFILAATLVAWVEWSVAALFSRTTIKFVSEAQDWRPVGAAVVWLHLLTSTGAALLLVLLAGPLAALLHEPHLAGYLRLFSLDIPLFSLAQAHRNILVGIGGFRERALASAGRWISRLLVIVLLVQLGFSVSGAILGSIAASLVELVIGRIYVRPALWRPAGFSVRPLWGYAVPLLLAAVSLRLFDKLDLISLKALGASAEQAGIYGAAQSLSLVPGIFALSFSPLLLSTLTRLLLRGEAEAARKMGRDAMRLVVGLLPFAGLVAGAAPEIVRLIFGQRFLSAAPLLALLLFGAVALMMVSVASAILIGAGKPGWTVALAGPLVPLALTGCFFFIPVWGPRGAALATALTAAAGALASILAVKRLWGILPSATTLLRSFLLSTLAYISAALWPAPGILLLVKLPAISLLICVAYFVLGEFSAAEMDLIRSILNWPGSSRKSAMEAE